MNRLDGYSYKIYVRNKTAMFQVLYLGEDNMEMSVEILGRTKFWDGLGLDQMSEKEKTAALIGIVLKLKTGSCWCGAGNTFGGIGNPIYKNHSAVCDETLNLLNRVAKL